MIRIQDIAKRFDGEPVLHGLSFDLPAQRTLGVLGKSGCGKTTLLKIMAGLVQPDQGKFEVEGQNLLALPPQQRGVVYLSQEPLLFPHLNVAENIGYGLKIRKVPSGEVRPRVTALLQDLELEGQGHRMPSQLSGGQRQRVAFGRALIISPRILLLDEPFGSLDAHTRREMQGLFRRVRQRYQITALFVTHDLKEALLMGDQIGQMEAGRLKVYPDVQTFIHAPESGVSEEIDFWQQLSQKHSESNAKF